MKRPAAVARAAPKKKPATQSREQVAERVDHEFPEPNARETPDLPSLGRDLNVAVPCTGIDGAGVALKKLKVPFKASMVFDLDARYHDYLSEHLPEGTTLHLGKVDGDVCKLEPGMVERPVDMLISGPPCPPWAGQGLKGGRQDPRAQVFIAVVSLVILLVKSGELVFTCLENVKGILEASSSGSASFMHSLLEVLRKEVDEFAWEYKVLKAQAYGLAQQRTRVPQRQSIILFHNVF